MFQTPFLLILLVSNVSFCQFGSLACQKIRFLDVLDPCSAFNEKGQQLFSLPIVLFS